MPTTTHALSLPLMPHDAPLPAFRWHTSADLAHEAGAARLHLNVRSLDPGLFSYPYHFHRQAEEVFVILAGRAMLRTPTGFSELVEGDVVVFETGPSGAHQLFNHTAEPCRYLDLATLPEVDVCEYPDTGKVAVLPYRLIVGANQRVGYYDGEEYVAKQWPAGIVGQQRDGVGGES